MIKKVEFTINDPNPQDRWVGGFAIQSNISKRIRVLNYLNYQKFHITLANGKTVESFIQKEGEKEVQIVLYVDFSQINSLKDASSISTLYKMIFAALTYVWKAKGWNEADIGEIEKSIELENYKVSVIHGKIVSSPKSDYKAQFYCELFPDYADYYLQFIKKKENVVRNIKFLKGPLNPDMVFGFFVNRYWRDNNYFLLTDSNKEIFYVFNTDSDEFQIEYFPKFNTIEQCKNYVQAFQAGNSRSDILRLLNLPYSK